MFKIIRQQQTIRRAIRLGREQTSRGHSKYIQRQSNVSTIQQKTSVGVRRMTSGGAGGNDAMLIATGFGVLGVTCTLV